LRSTLARKSPSELRASVDLGPNYAIDSDPSAGHGSSVIVAR
jgi:hypothetical protein